MNNIYVSASGEGNISEKDDFGYGRYSNWECRVRGDRFTVNLNK